MSKFLSIRTGLALTAGLTLASAISSQSTLTWVKDINLNPNTTTSPSNPYPNRTYENQNSNKYAEMGGFHYFAATNSKTGTELYKSDGTKAGTTLIKDIYPGASSSSPYYFCTVGKMVYFRANDGKTGS